MFRIMVVVVIINAAKESVRIVVKTKLIQGTVKLLSKLFERRGRGK